MKFYDLKTRQHVEVAEGNIMKKKMVRKTKTGEQTRYALVGKHDGRELFKFVSEAVYKSTNAPDAK